MGTTRVSLRVSTWFNERDIELTFPDTWQVQECRMAGHDRPALSEAEMRAAIQNPIGSPRLKDLAQGKERVAILFDDMVKPTPTSRIVPFVLEELRAGGIVDDQIRFVCAPGTHRPLIYTEFAAKLGADIVCRYPVYNHSIWENLAYVGTTSRGTPVHVNREYASCDLRLGIGSVIPHGLAGFGGGGKIILPGISGIDTVEHHHKNRARSTDLAAFRGEVDGNVFRLDIEEAARLAGLQFKVDSVLGPRREVVGLFAGDLVAEHRAACRLANEVYHTVPAVEADVVVVNCYPDEPQWPRGTWAARTSLRAGGDAVLVNHSYEGQNLNQYGSRLGTDFGGRGYRPGQRTEHVASAGRVIVFGPHLSMYDRQELGRERVIWCREWGEVLAELASAHGPGTRVAVYPCAPLQLVK